MYVRGLKTVSRRFVAYLYGLIDLNAEILSAEDIKSMSPIVAVGDLSGSPSDRLFLVAFVLLVYPSSEIFLNLPDLFHLHHKLYADLKKIRDEGHLLSHLGQTLQLYTPFLKLYLPFVEAAGKTCIRRVMMAPN